MDLFIGRFQGIVLGRAGASASRERLVKAAMIRLTGGGVNAGLGAGPLAAQTGGYGPVAFAGEIVVA
jgi:hypothetical protein